MLFTKTVAQGFLTIFLILSLADGPSYGNAIIKDIYKMTGFWKPSPGSIYPALQKLKKQKLIEIKHKEKKIYYQLTKEGEKFLRKIEDAKPELIKNLEALIMSLKNNE
ncbi:MAG: hypothetical protein DRO96_02010 [Candidatus Aenigmatarchaeota archaeon]|nr:MAG: hypothetical protein B6U68_01640 [Candidatus Aenigmarchaeota archaeon ex4484_14]RLI96904.1 MAG: hypothetical protein DRO96_02010 [Candidatus Aenigmarchaeota archaeon]